MWTPKRILILIGTLILFLTGFSVYAYFLGGIDGLPPLPDEWGYRGGADVALLPPPDPSDVDKRLASAFGTDCQEIRRRIKLDLRSKGWAFAADSFETKDGRVELKPFSACIFPRARADAKFPEINTIQCEVAYLTLDRPVTNHMELANRRVVGVELRGSRNNEPLRGLRGIILSNNRQTPDPHDDIEVVITEQSLFYDDAKSLVWSNGSVSLVDWQTQPETRIEAIGMELHLLKDPPSAKTAKTDKTDKKRAKGEAINGVDRLILLSHVHMWLSVDGGPGFLGNNQVSGRKKSDDGLVNGPVNGPVKKPERSQVHIQTAGRFSYDAQKDKAIFESPPPKAQGAEHEPIAPGQVTVDREHRDESGDGKMFDQLVCDYLEIQFRRKPAEGLGGVRDDRGGREIDSAYAKALPGSKVTLAMDTENLDAEGLEMTFRGPTEKSGPQTLLKGTPLRASKDGHRLEAEELLLIGADKNDEGQQAVVSGDGHIDFFDKTNPTQSYPLHVSWKGKLTTSKVKEGGRIFDLLILTQDACFIDEEHKQALHGDRLEVMLEPTARTDPAKPGAPTRQAGPGAPRQRPYKIDAFGNVRALSPEFNVRRADILQVRFNDSLPAEERLPESLPPIGPLGSPPGSPPRISGVPAMGGVLGKTTSLTGKLAPDADKTFLAPLLPSPKSSIDALLPQPAPPPLDGSATAKVAAAPTDMPNAKSRPPIELEARQVTAVIKRGGSKDQLHELISEGNVHVHQEPEKPGDKGIDIKGSLLHLLHHAGGDTLQVFGDSRRAAELQLGELYLMGPNVTINQKDNVAEVHGVGAMSMPSKTTFDGGQTKKETRLEVHWNDDMHFDGKTARFSGGIQARQDTAWMLCANLQVELDRMVSFKEGQGKGERPKAEKIVCDKKVIVVDEVRDAKGAYLKYHALTGTFLEVDNLDEKSRASGPGQIILLAPGNSDIGPLGPSPAKGSAVQPAVPAQQMKLTRIFYTGGVWNLSKTKVTTIRENVQIYHFPANRPDAQMNADRPFKDAFYMKCDRLDISTRDLGEGKLSRRFQAKDRVECKGETFFARATWVTYDESSEQIVFQGTAENPATLYQNNANDRGGNLKARKILYNRRTGQFSVEGGREINGQ